MGEKLAIAVLQTPDVGSCGTLSGEDLKALVVDALDPASEHPAVDLLEHVLPDVEGEVRTDAEDLVVEGGVVDLARGEAVRNDGLSVRLAVGDDVRGVQELSVLGADRALAVVGEQHLGAEDALMQAGLGEALGVAAHVGVE